MTQESASSFTPQDVDFDSLYRGGSLFAGTELRFEQMPWEIGEPQPALVELERSGAIRGEVLDIGCGRGTNTLFLAGRGYRVLGVDISSVAIGQARQHARDSGVDAEFAVADATRLDGIEQRFDTVVDSAAYHGLDGQQRRDYAAAVYRVSKPDAVLHLFGIDASAPECGGLLDGRLGVDEAGLRTVLGGLWELTDFESIGYTSAFTRESLAAAMRQSDLAGSMITFDGDAMAVDDRDRILVPFLRVRGVRRTLSSK